MLFGKSVKVFPLILACVLFATFTETGSGKPSNSTPVVARAATKFNLDDRDDCDDDCVIVWADCKASGLDPDWCWDQLEACIRLCGGIDDEEDDAVLTK